MVFDKGNKKEVLKEIAFGSTGTGTYKVYYTEGDASNKTVDDMTYLGSGTLSDYGYVTHKLDNPIFIDIADVANQNISYLEDKEIRNNMELTQRLNVMLSEAEASI